MPQVIDSRTVFQSTPSARRATGRLFQDFRGRYISIHALREEGDAGPVVFHHTSIISIHALREEGDLVDLRGRGGVAQFQSTPSARRATDVHMDEDPRIHISIHALREEGDLPASSTKLAVVVFQSTPSARRAT